MPLNELALETYLERRFLHFLLLWHQSSRSELVFSLYQLLVSERRCPGGFALRPWTAINSHPNRQRSPPTRKFVLPSFFSPKKFRLLLVLLFLQIGTLNTVDRSDIIRREIEEKETIESARGRQNAGFWLEGIVGRLKASGLCLCSHFERVRLPSAGVQLSAFAFECVRRRSKSELYA